MIDHAIFLEQKGIIETNNLSKEWIRNKKSEDLTFELSEIYRNSIAGLSEKDLLIDDFMKDYVYDAENYYRKPFLNILESKRRKDTDIYVISGSASFLVEKFVKFFGFKSMSSFYLKDNQGNFTGEYINLSGLEAKRECVNRIKNVEGYQNIIAYGDTFNDLALFEKAQESFLIDPTYETFIKFSKIRMFNDDNNVKILEHSDKIAPPDVIIYKK